MELTFVMLLETFYLSNGIKSHLLNSLFTWNTTTSKREIELITYYVKTYDIHIIKKPNSPKGMID
jgi:hypothetical protein